MKMEDDPDTREQIFHNTVREYIIFLLLFILLYGASYVVIGRFRRRNTDDYFSTDEEEATVFSISLWLCTFSLAVALGAALLLPVSIVSNEVLALYPDSYYVQWLNHSLVQGMWSTIFLFSNLSLFAFLPFAYLFTESEGFSGHRKGLAGRVYETLVVLVLLAATVLGMTAVVSSLFDEHHSNMLALLLNLGSTYLPFLYSCISFLGALILLLCTPLGLERLFATVLVRPQFLRDMPAEYSAALLEERSLERRLEASGGTGRNGETVAGLRLRLAEATTRRRLLGEQWESGSLGRAVLYPVALVMLAALTALAVVLVAQNTLGLLVGVRALPGNSQDFVLGLQPLSQLGVAGAALQVALAGYLLAAGATGAYSAPGLHRLRPRVSRTPFTHVIANCALLLLVSSAVPLAARVLGFTSLDLLGDFGRVHWLSSLRVVLLYNLVFSACAALCLANRFTAAVRQDLWHRLRRSLSSLLGDDVSDGPAARLWAPKED